MTKKSFGKILRKDATAHLSDVAEAMITLISIYCRAMYVDWFLVSFPCRKINRINFG